ncbi:MAG: aromatic ring-hydroxylating dioxygenase subunit alpha [Novosphingobium sp.]|nr:aromatic ring-hydroxylating dioxygenase subunit alpha [Novosphingobium sp.]
MYARNAWYVAAWSDELEDDKPTGMKILGEPIVLFRSSKTGKVAVLEDRCVHRLAPLSLGRCEGANLRCMYHGLLFNPDGQVVEIPGQEKIPPQARVRAYPAVERANWVWVWMGDPALADEALIPPAIGPDSPDYIMGQGHLDYDAEASLINDNLLDFSHLTFVHAESFEAPDDFADSLPKVETLDRGVRYSRWMVDATGPVGRRTEELIDNYMCYDFVVPGVLLMWNGSFPRGTAEACDFGPPDRDAAIASVTLTSQAVTPMEDGKARYFFCWGPHKQHGDADLRDFLMGIGAKAFAEDKVMIEAQYKVIGSTAAPVVMPTAHDKGVTIFNRMVEKMAREDAR